MGRYSRAACGPAATAGEAAGVPSAPDGAATVSMPTPQRAWQKRTSGAVQAVGWLPGHVTLGVLEAYLPAR